MVRVGNGKSVKVLVGNDELGESVNGYSFRRRLHLAVLENYCGKSSSRSTARASKRQDCTERYRNITAAGKMSSTTLTSNKWRRGIADKKHYMLEIIWLYGSRLITHAAGGALIIWSARASF